MSWGRAGVAVLEREKPRRRVERPNGPRSSVVRPREASALVDVSED